MKWIPTIALALAAFALSAADLDTIGVTLLRKADASLNGNGVRVAQAEGEENTNTPATFEVNPAAVGQPASLFSWTASNTTVTVFPNSIGGESGHADSVGGNFYGVANGVATNVSHVDNYEATHFYYNIVSATPSPPSIPAPIVNQSFIIPDAFIPEATVNQNYDNYAAQRSTLFISAAGNSGAPSAPATAYNSIGVGVYGASSSTGPTSDGRCKPDITAPSGATSFSTPCVSGAAAVLLQAARRGDGGAGNISSATNFLTLKTLLLNGAVKPADWTNSATQPFDYRYGAGILNAANSWRQLAAGRYTFIDATAVGSGNPHPPGANTNNIASLTGWNYAAITPPGPLFNRDEIHHYYFNLAPTNARPFTLTATLAWNRQNGQNAINGLSLFLYNIATGSLVASSESTVDNVQHIYIPSLPPGRYDLQVEKIIANSVTTSETYALAFEFFNIQTAITRTNGGVTISWPAFPAGFTLQSAASLAAPISWTPATATPTFSSNQNLLTLPPTNTARYFRLQRP